MVLLLSLITLFASFSSTVTSQEATSNQNADLESMKQTLAVLQAALGDVINKVNAITEDLNKLKNSPASPETNDSSSSGNVIWTPAHKVNPRDCLEILDAGDSQGDGVYRIYDPAEGKFINVRCSMDCDGGGWLVLMRRAISDDGKSKNANFNQNWKKYKKGFGDLFGEFWMGLDYMHTFTQQHKQVDMRLDLVTFENDHMYVQYKNFFVNDEANKYKLHLGSFSGSWSSTLNYNNGRYFSTYDVDNDGYSSINCASRHGGGWWFYPGSTCGNVWPTGKIDADLQQSRIGGIAYGTSYSSTSYYRSFKEVTMKVRPAYGLP